MNISIIILNWNGREHLATCLHSIFNQTYKQFEVIFVDNASRDDSIEYVKKNWPLVKIIQEHKNTGFAEGNNIGIRQALKNPEIEYVVTLNNDTEVAPDWLKELVAIAETDERIGAVSSKILFFDQRNLIDSTGDFLLPHSLKVVARGYRQRDVGQYESVEECFSARAAAALYRRQMLEDICLDGDFFDRHFFAYIEDVDLSVRARLRGWKILYAPRSVIYHKVASTSKRLSHIFRRYHAGRNRLFTAIKNYPVGLWLTSIRERASVDDDYRLSFLENATIYSRIIGSLLISLPRLLRQRRYIQRRKKIGKAEIRGWMEKFEIK